jgi:lipopolysaccharide/colanic/teichoic acid biosynthesis glycosyltransferase
MHAFRKSVSVRIYLLGLIEALFTAACYIAAVYISHPVDANTYLELDGGAFRIAVITVTFLIAIYLFDLHRQPRPPSRLVLALQLCQLVGIILLVQSALAFVDPDLILEQSVIVVGSSFLLVFLVLWRLFVRPVLWSGFGAQRVLFVGYSGPVEDLRSAFDNEPFRSLEVIGFVVDANCLPVSGRVLGTPDRLREIVRESSPDRVIVEGEHIHSPQVLRDLLDLGAAGLTVETASQAYESEFARVDCRGLHPYTVVFLESLMTRPGSMALQAVYTNIFGLIATILMLPLMTLIVVAKKIFGAGPVMVPYRCIGLHGIPFNLYLFHCPPESKNLVDRFLRRYKLVGLPQMLNLIRGEIALLGPRPERAEIDAVLSELIPFYNQKQSVKPGLYGWSQLHCDTMPEEDTLRRLEYDLYYIKHVSVALDIYIVLRAIRWIVSGQRYAPNAQYAGDVLGGLR